MENKAKQCWCFTIFKMDTDMNVTDKRLKYMVYQREISSKTGKLHFQGFIQFDKVVRMKAVKKIFKNNSMHLEGMRGTREQARNYCMKERTREIEDAEPIELGEWVESKQGQRTDLEYAYELCKEGKKNVEILEEIPATYMRYSKGIKEAKFLLKQRDGKKWRKIKTKVYIGPTGVGKSRKSRRKCEDYFVMVNDGKWWDGYDGQKRLIMEDFYGEVPWGQLLRLLDGYQIQLPVKGGFTWAEWTEVIITSNDSIESWYEKDDISALKRRIKRVINL